MRSLVLVLALLATPTAAADQFDLVCKGDYRTQISGNRTPFEARYRVDLAAGRWCEGPCNGTQGIFEVTDAKITFINRDRRASAATDELLWVDRTTGAYSYIRAGGIGNFEERKAKCEAVAFSGFPAVQRQF